MLHKNSGGSGRHPAAKRPFRDALCALFCTVVCVGLQGCLVIGASSRGGFFLWPGGLGLLALLALFVLLGRRR